MKTKIEILDSNGLRKAEVLLHRIREYPYYFRQKSRVKAFMKVEHAIKFYDDLLIQNQLESPRHLFDYNTEIEEPAEYTRLNDGFAMLGVDC